MIGEFGQFCLVFALALATAQAALPWAGRRDPVIAGLARRCAPWVALGTALALIALIQGAARADFSLALVSGTVHSLTPMAYRVTGVLTTPTGMALLVVLTLALAVPGGPVGGVETSRRARRARTRLAALGGALTAAALLTVLLFAPPFARLAPAPLDGAGLSAAAQAPAAALIPLALAWSAGWLLAAAARAGLGFVVAARRGAGLAAPGLAVAIAALVWERLGDPHGGGWWTWGGPEIALSAAALAILDLLDGRHRSAGVGTGGQEHRWDAVLATLGATALLLTAILETPPSWTWSLLGGGGLAALTVIRWTNGAERPWCRGVVLGGLTGALLVLAGAKAEPVILATAMGCAVAGLALSWSAPTGARAEGPPLRLALLLPVAALAALAATSVDPAGPPTPRWMAPAGAGLAAALAMAGVIAWVSGQRLPGQRTALFGLALMALATGATAGWTRIEVASLPAGTALALPGRSLSHDPRPAGLPDHGQNFSRAVTAYRLSGGPGGDQRLRAESRFYPESPERLDRAARSVALLAVVTVAPLPAGETTAPRALVTHRPLLGLGLIGLILTVIGVPRLAGAVGRQGP